MSLAQVSYRFGYSFENPRLVRKATQAKSEPWFKMKYAPQGPTQVRRDLFNSGKLANYPSIWRRAAKRVHKERLSGLSDIDERIIENASEFESVELPDFEELGQAPGPTVRKPVTQERSFWGSLQSMLTKTSDVLIQREQTKQAMAQAEIVARTQPTGFIPTLTDGVNWPIIGLIGVGGLLIYSVMNR